MPHLVTDPKLARQIQRLCGLRANRKAIEKEEKPLKETVRAYMKRADQTVITTETGCKVKLTTQHRSYLDEDRIAEDLGVDNLDEYRNKVETTPRMYPTLPKR